MLQRLKKMMYVGSATAVMMFSGLFMPVALANVSAATSIKDNLCSGSNSASGGSGDSCGTAGTDGNTEAALGKVANNITRIFTIIVGAISVIMIIYGGFRYITSGGASDKVGSAKNTLIYAIIGLIIVALANVIVSVVINQASTQGTGFTGG
jgi:predicted permease